MEAIIALAILVIALAGFDAAANAFGADSRDQLPDDHHRGRPVSLGRESIPCIPGRCTPWRSHGTASARSETGSS